jgi:hypothetical protein
MNYTVYERSWQDGPGRVIITFVTAGYFYRGILTDYFNSSLEAFSWPAIKEEFRVLPKVFPLFWRQTVLIIKILVYFAGLDNDSYPAIAVPAILLSDSDLNLVPRGLINWEHVFMSYLRDSIQVPYQINMLLELVQREEAIAYPEFPLDQHH